MKHCVLGILAHVDAGKTTTAEALLLNAGVLRKAGRVDHQDSFLDHDRLERARGITIFSKQAVFELGSGEDSLTVDLLDTPGHRDLSGETERTLSVLDYVLLIISAPDGVEAHTETLWKLLKRYHIPAFVFVNKTDICQKTQDGLLAEISGRLGHCVDFSSEASDRAAFLESVSLGEEGLLNEYLNTGELKESSIAAHILTGDITPVYFGSALYNQGVRELAEGIRRFVIPRSYPAEVRARVYKITHDPQGKRVTHLKLTGGTLKVRELLGEEKITQIRRYSGAGFTTLEEAEAGGIYGILGPESSYAGKGYGGETDSGKPSLTPIYACRADLPAGTDISEVYLKLKALEEEDPLLHVIWNREKKYVGLELMGDIQKEVLESLIPVRCGFPVKLSEGEVTYRETVAAPVIGVGHFEPLRHYAEVHLLIEPLPAGTGILYESALSQDELDINWQKQILSELAARTQLGVLTGAPLTDVKITLIAGRAHLKHTEGGDFRQACWRALRQGLMQADNVLLEPYFDFTLEVPREALGRAVSDAKRMAAQFGAPEETQEDMLSVSGTVPASEIGGYTRELLAYTHGKGRLYLQNAGYHPCHNTAAVIERTDYDPEKDPEHTADSVFCSHGAGVNVKWNCVSRFMHLESGITLNKNETGKEISVSARPPRVRNGSLDFDDKELEAIMQREFGEIKRPRYAAVSYSASADKASEKPEAAGEYLIVDGYNIIHAWDELNALLDTHGTDAACLRLMDILADYHGYRGGELIAVFDGYRRRFNPGTREDYHGIRIVFTKEGESADYYIEKLVHEIGKNYKVRVATSDSLIQLQALRSGVIRMSARELRYEVEKAKGEIRELLESKRQSPVRLEDVLNIPHDFL